MIVLTATWRARAGEEERVRRILEEITPLVRGEPGCAFYQANQSTEDPTLFLLYEQFVDQAAFDAHTEAEHFKKYVLEQAIPLLESRQRAFYALVGEP